MSLIRNEVSMFEAMNTNLVIGAHRNTGSGPRIEVIDPSTGSIITSVANASVEDGIAAIDAASDAASGWRDKAPRERAELLRRCWELMMTRSEDLAQIISRENGKALTDARAEVRYAAEFFRWYSEEAVRLIGDFSVAPSGDNRILVQYEPVGVAILVTPWNFPAAMITRKVAPALAAGATVVLKPATLTPLTAYAILEIIREAGVPDGVVNLITTRDTHNVVSNMLHHPSVRALSFTGSTEVGKILLREAADQVLKCSMELGGNAAFIVLDDANLDEALDAVMLAKMRNGGQACTAANRIFVQNGIMKQFGDALVERMSNVRMGCAYSEDTELGPLISTSAVRKIDELVQDALARGAESFRASSHSGQEGFFYPPTVITNVVEGSTILSEEIFGPVASLISFDTDEEVIDRANETDYGLSAYVFGGDLGRALRIAERLESGMVGVNRGLVSDPAAPFGGVKQSGLGREGAKEGILEFAEAKYIAIEW